MCAKMEESCINMKGFFLRLIELEKGIDLLLDIYFLQFNKCILGVTCNDHDVVVFFRLLVTDLLLTIGLLVFGCHSFD